MTTKTHKKSPNSRRFLETGSPREPADSSQPTEQVALRITMADTKPDSLARVPLCGWAGGEELADFHKLVAFGTQALYDAGESFMSFGCVCFGDVHHNN